MSQEHPEQDYLAVLAHYGKTMASIQWFERAMIQLTRLIYPQLSEEIPFEPAWRRLQRQLRKTDGPLAKHLGESRNRPQEVVEDIRHLLEGRKNLAHEFLLGYTIEGNAGVADNMDKISVLEAAEADFLAWSAFVGSLCEALALELGVNTGDPDPPLADLWQSLEQEDVRDLCTAYGTAMFAVQMWELSLKGLLIYFDLPEDDEDADVDDTWETVERTLTTAAGPLRGRLEEQAYGQEDLYEKLEILRNHRNDLAHRFFVDYARASRERGPEAHTEALGRLEELGALFWEHKETLDALSDEMANERGWDLNDLGGLTEEELWRIALQEDEPDEQ